MSIVPIGIDLGTTFSCVSYIDHDGQTKCVPNPFAGGKNIFPSVVFFPRVPNTSGQYVPSMCSEAEQNGRTYPKNKVYAAKRMIGRSGDDESLQKDIANYSYDVTIDELGNPNIVIGHDDGTTSTYTPTEISSLILRYLKSTAESFLSKTGSFGDNVVCPKAVITVPADFTSEQRRATRTAAQLAGLDVLRICSEPTAAAIAYIESKYRSSHKAITGTETANLLMFDLGGGTFDVSIVSVSQDGFLVRATSGNNHFGGEDIDSSIMDELKKRYSNDPLHVDTKPQFPTDEGSQRKLRALARTIKEHLTSNLHYTYTLSPDDYPIENEVQGVYQASQLSLLIRRRFDMNCTPIVQDALAKASFHPQDINEVVLVGGSTRSLAIAERLKAILGKNAISSQINPDEAVARGAAYLAHHLYQKESSNLVTVGMVKNVDTTKTSLAKGELCTATYAVSNADDPSSLHQIIVRGAPLPSTGHYTFTVSNIDMDGNRIYKPILLRIHEGEEKRIIENAKQRLLQNWIYKMEFPPIFEISVARDNNIQTQTIRLHFSVDTDGILDVFVLEDDVVGNKMLKIQNIDDPSVRANIIQNNTSISDDITTITTSSTSSTSSTSPTHAKPTTSQPDHDDNDNLNTILNLNNDADIPLVLNTVKDDDISNFKRASPLADFYGIEPEIRSGQPAPLPQLATTQAAAKKVLVDATSAVPPCPLTRISFPRLDGQPIPPAPTQFPKAASASPMVRRPTEVSVAVVSSVSMKPFRRVAAPLESK